MEEENNRKEENGLTDKAIIKWGTILFVISIYGYLYLKIMFIE